MMDGEHVTPVTKVNTLIVGGGPAGLAPLISAGRTGDLEPILAGGLALAERGPAIGGGRIGGYAINSDSTAKTFVSLVMDNPHPSLARLRAHPTTQAVAAHGLGPVPLALVGEFMAVVGASLHELITATGNHVLLDHEAVHTKRTRTGLWRTEFRRSDGSERSVLSRFVVLATGGHQPRSCLENENIGGRPLLPNYADKLIQSDDLLRRGGFDAVEARLAASGNRRIAIIGSSSSALASANALLKTEFGKNFGEAAVTVLHRRPLRVFYPSAEDALAEGYDEFGPDDICPVSGFVFRFAGFRLDSRELVMAARGIGGRPPEKRLRLHHLASGPDPVALNILDEAEVIVVALGYRPRALPVLGAAGEPIALFAHDHRSRPLVDDQCRVLDEDGVPIHGLLGIGLATGFVSREIGGEPSFSGQTNGVWQWQNDVGAVLVRQIQGRKVEASKSGALLNPNTVTSLRNAIRSVAAANLAVAIQPER